MGFRLRTARTARILSSQITAASLDSVRAGGDRPDAVGVWVIERLVVLVHRGSWR